MDKRWGKIESIFNKVLEADEDRRSAVLEESCAGDESLKREVESLLSHHRNAADFIERPAFEDVVPAPSPAKAQSPQQSLKGALVAHYRVLEEIGVGGMGIVYKAEDIKLQRPVALKFLPERLAVDSVAVERFRREARAASALNHPNICTIYEIEQHDDREFIAMEFLQGQTLATYIAGQAHGADAVAKLGISIAEALAAAHLKGVIHRDLKPGNIFVTSSGLVKVLDFGVAKLLQAADSATTLDALTETNAITGTLPYMSPEQLCGEDLDARSDIYALGVVLYEIATGQRPYASSLQGKLIDEILHQPAAPPSSSNRKLPPKLDEIILKCLEKTPENRYQTAQEIAVDLRRMSAPTTGQVSIPKQHSKVRLWAIGIGTGVLMTAAVVWYLLPTAQPRLTGSKRLTENEHASADPIAADSSGVYFNTGGVTSPSQIRQVTLNGGETTEFRSAIPDAAMLDVSPDRSQLLAMSGGDPYGHDLALWALPLPAGSPRRLGDIKADYWGARWSPDMKSLVFIRGPELWLANSDGTEPRRIASVEGEPFRPAFSPDGKKIRFSVRNLTSSIWEVRVDGSNLHQILPAWHKSPHECCGIWTPDGRYYVFRSTSRNDWLERFGFGDLYVIPDSSDVFHRSPSVPVQLTFGPLAYALGGFTPKGNKLLVTANDPRPELVRYDFKSRKLVPFLNIVGAQFVAFSQDGKRIAYVKTSDDTLWISGADGNNRFQLTYPPDHASLPRWSRDGTKIAFMRSQLGKPSEAVVISSEGGMAEELDPGETSDDDDPNWSPDGTRIVFSAGSRADIRIVDVQTRQVSQVPGSAGKFSPRWSPDGRYLAAIDASEAKKLYLFDFQTGKWLDWITDADGIGYQTWTPDSHYVRYRSGSGCKRIRVGDNHPEVLFSFKGLVEGLVEYITTAGGWTDVAPDGSWMFIHDASTQDIYALDVDFP